MLTRMSSFAHGVLNALDVLFTAGRAASAMELGVTPNARDLSRLGIKPSSFAAIRHV